MGTKEVPQQGILLPLPPELEEFKAASCWATYGGRAKGEDANSEDVRGKDTNNVSPEQAFAFRPDYNPNYVTPEVGRTVGIKAGKKRA